MAWELSEVFDSSFPVPDDLTGDESATALEQLTELVRSAEILRRALLNEMNSDRKTVSAAAKRIRHIASDLQAFLAANPSDAEAESAGHRLRARTGRERPNRQSTDRNSFNKLLEAVPDIALVFSRDGVFLDFKISSPSVLITPPQYFLGKTIYEVYPREAAQRFADHIIKTFDTGEGQRWEFKAPVPLHGGELRAFEARSVPMNDMEVAVIVFNQDQNYLVLNQQKAISHGLHAILSSIDELMGMPLGNDFYRQAMELARERLGLERVALYFLSGESSVRGSYGTDLDGRTCDESAGLIPLVEHPIYPLLCTAHDQARWIEGEVPLYEWTGDRFRRSQVGRAAVTRLSASDNPIGYFYNDNGLTGRNLDPIRQELLVVYSSLLGTLLESKRIEQALSGSEARYKVLYAEAESALARTQALYDASRSIIGSAGLSAIVRSVADSVSRALNADHVKVLILDEVHRKVIHAVVDSLNPNPREHTPLSYDEAVAGLTGVVMCTNRTMQSDHWQPDLRESPIVRIHRGCHFGTCSVTVTPLQYQDRVIGTITVVNRAPKAPLNESDLDLLVALASQTAIAIESARLQEETEGRAAALALQAEELARSNTDLEQFAYVASHDLQEPLRTVSGFVQLCLHRYQDVIPEDGKLLLAQSLEASERMRALILDLLAYSRVGTLPQAQESVDVRQVLEHVIASLRPLLTENKAEITWDALPVVVGDEIRLQQLFQNLISNSIKFRREAPPRIHVSAKLTEDRWLFSVEDNGIGIDPDQYERIFMVFQRLHTRQEYPGTGIGLAICKRIIERQKGRIWVESIPEQGTTFFFTLPTAKSELGLVSGIESS